MKQIAAVCLITILLLVGCGGAVPLETVPETTVEETLSTSEEAASLCEKGAAAVKVEDYESAETLYLQAVGLDETFAEGWLGLVDVYIRTGDFAAAEETLSKAQEAVSDDQIAEKLKELESGEVKDSSGLLRRLSSFDENGHLLWYHYLSYYPDGRLHTTTAYDGDENQISFVETIYDEAGRELQWYNTSWKDGKLLLVKNTYDDQNRLIAEHYYLDDTGEILGEYCLFERDEWGNQISASLYSADGTFEGKTASEFDEQGREIKHIEYESNGDILYWCEMVYDEKDCMIQLCEYDPAGKLSRMRLHEYETFGNKVCPVKESEYDGNGTLKDTTIYEYDENGNRILSVHYDADGNETARYVVGG